jgi:hypothetical protein
MFAGREIDGREGSENGQLRKLGTDHIVECRVCRRSVRRDLSFVAYRGKSWSVRHETGRGSKGVWRVANH